MTRAPKAEMGNLLRDRRLARTLPALLATWIVTCSTLVGLLDSGESARPAEDASRTRAGMGAGRGDSMYLKSIKLKNFRSFDMGEVELQKDLTVFVGENNGGKSNAIDGLRLLTAP